MSARPRRPRTLPPRLTLPSGRRVVLSDSLARRASGAHDDLPPVARGIAILRSAGVVATPEGEAVDIDAMALRDAHLLRAILGWAGVIAENDRQLHCHNCGKDATIGPSVSFEPGPFVDDELDDPELDRPFDFGARHRIPRIFTVRRATSKIQLEPRTVEETQALLLAERPLRITPAVVAALGIRRLGELTSAPQIARALQRASDEAWSAVLALYEQAHYSPRLVAEERCPCGARLEHPVPADRELDLLAPAVDIGREVAAEDPALGPDEFDAQVHSSASDVFRRRGVRNIEVIVDHGVPACDDGGEPLLGCYTPPTPDGATGFLPQGPEIRIFYRSFVAERAFDPDFDVSAEITETIDHEVEHHLNFLTGEDPLDDEEREAILLEQLSLVGRRESLRRAAGGFGRDLMGFVRAAFPLLALLAALAAIRACAHC